LLPNATKGAKVKKQELKDKVTEYGDAVITYRSENSNKLKYNVCTLDFSTPYIHGKRNRAKETDSTLLFFCWDTDSYRLLKPESVTTVVPLSNILKNEK
jgi:hypothetical protein